MILGDWQRYKVSEFKKLVTAPSNPEDSFLRLGFPWPRLHSLPHRCRDSEPLGNGAVVACPVGAARRGFGPIFQSSFRAGGLDTSLEAGKSPRCLGEMRGACQHGARGRTGLPNTSRYCLQSVYVVGTALSMLTLQVGELGKTVRSHGFKSRWSSNGLSSLDEPRCRAIRTVSYTEMLSVHSIECGMDKVLEMASYMMWMSKCILTLC